MKLMTESKPIFLGRNGEQLGPFNEDEVRAKWAAGELLEVTIFWTEGEPKWRSFSELRRRLGLYTEALPERAHGTAVIASAVTPPGPEMPLPSAGLPRPAGAIRCECGTISSAQYRFCGRCGKPLDASKVVFYEASGPGGAGGVIPYDNKPSLAAYYLGIFSFFPLTGLVTGFAAVYYGFKGLERSRQLEGRQGRKHSIAGMIIGGFFGLVYLALLVVMFALQPQ